MIVQHLPNLWRVGGHSWNGRAPSLSPSGGNVYLLDLPDAALLIDCGTTAERETIEANVRETGVEPEKLTDLIITHTHYDHAGAAADWQKAYGLRIHLHSVGAERLARGDYRLTGSQLNSPGYAFERFVVDHAAGDGETFEAAGATFTAHDVPGHTPDCLLLTTELDGKKVGFCGDVTFGPNGAGDLGNVGWLCLVWDSDLHAYRDSLKRMTAMRFDLLLPGHGDALVGQADAAEAIAASLATIEHFLADPLMTNFGMKADG